MSRGKCIYVEYQGRKVSVGTLSRLTGVSAQVLRKRISRRLTGEQLTSPAAKCPSSLVPKGVYF